MEFFIMILPKTGDNYLTCILLCFHMEHGVQPCNMFGQNIRSMFFTKFYGNSTFMVIAWILVKNIGVHLDCFWQKHGAKKLAMSTKWMQDIFSPMFCLCSQGEDLQCFCGKKISPVLCANILREHICHFQGRHQMFLPIIVSCMVTITRNSAAKTGNMFSSNVCTQNWTYFFSPNHWRCSPWGHRKNIGESISCICLVDIANFLAPCFFIHVFAINNQNELHYFFYQNSCYCHKGRTSIELGKKHRACILGKHIAWSHLMFCSKTWQNTFLSNYPLSLAKS